MRYRTKVTQDTSKRGKLTRIQKRERVLLFCYFYGKIHKVDGIFEAHIYLPPSMSTIFKDMVKPVDWFVYGFNDEKECYILKDAPNKNYMRFINKRIKAKTSKALKRGILQYLYSPLALFIMLVANNTMYVCDYLYVYFSHNLEAEAVQEWLEKVYRINVRVFNDRKLKGIVFDMNEYSKAFAVIENDKYVGKYYKNLIQLIKERN